MKKALMSVGASAAIYAAFDIMLFAVDLKSYVVGCLCAGVVATIQSIKV